MSRVTIPQRRSLVRGDVKAAFKLLRTQRLRSLTTMLGVVIAVAAVILIVGIGEGVKQQVQSQVDRLSKGLIMIRPGGNSTGINGSINRLAGFAGTASLGSADLQAIQTAKGVETVVPLGIIDGKVVSDDRNQSFNGSVIATGADFADVLHQKIDYGGFLDDEGNDGRAVVGEQVATQVFGEAVPLGRSFTFHNQTFIVSGIMHRFEANPLLGDADFNNSIFINYSTAQNLVAANPPLYEILAQAHSDASVDGTVQAITTKLLTVHGGSRNFSVLQQSQSLATTDSILNLLTEFIIGAAAVTMLIGAIGIMNIMLVSVTERMHEIGIRKAIGATSRQILSQFMMEAAVLSLAGSIVGFALAGVLILVLRLFTEWQPAMPWVSAGLTIGVAVLLGVLFGSIPALKAARKDPIAALRNE